MLNTKIIGNKIAEARKKKNISQATLAQQLFISSQAVGKWERGESMPDIITLNCLAEILGVDLNYFSENFQTDFSETDSKKNIESNSNLEQTVEEVTYLSTTTVINQLHREQSAKERLCRSNCKERKI